MQGAFVKHYDHDTVTPDQFVQGLSHVYQYDHDFISIKNQYKPDFYEYFGKAFDNYVDGDWINANSNLTVAYSMNHTDGPTRWMNEYLEKNKNLAPEDWSGARNIDHKEKAPEINFANPDMVEGEGEDQDIGTDNQTNAT
jgi:hypothetical protein